MPYVCGRRLDGIARVAFTGELEDCISESAGLRWRGRAGEG